MIYHIIKSGLIPIAVVAAAGWGLAWLIERILRRHE
jgi:hypothetical protein